MSTSTKTTAAEEAYKADTEARNYDKYAINGAGSYGKARMVEAVVNTYVKNNPSITIEALREVFPPYLLKGYGVIRTEDGTIKDYKRFYKSQLPNGTVFYICNQWGKDNTDVFVQYVNDKVAGVKISNADDQTDAVVADAAAIAAAEKAKAEAEKAQVEAAKAEAERMKAEAEKMRAEAAVAAAAAEKAAAEKAQAEAVKKALAEAEAAKKELEALKKAQAEAEAAKKEVERMKAEADKMRAEAEKARLEAEKAAAEKAKAEAIKKEIELAGGNVDLCSGIGALTGKFTINDKGGKICFSQGALQFNPAKYEFRFAKNQYDIIGKDNEKIAPNYDGWIDLFGWGTSGFMGCQPTEVSNKDCDYGPSTGDIAGTNYDWGVYNPITNGGNKEGIWRTMTKDEWGYLATKRPNASKLKVLCTVCGVQGSILMPDDFWNNRLRLPLDITAENASVNTYNAEQWTQLEALGVVFIPSIGYREGKTWKSDGIYWLSTNSSTDNAYAFTDYCYSNNWYNKRKGRGVRLVKDIK